MNNKSFCTILAFVAVFSILIMVLPAPAVAPGQDAKSGMYHGDTNHNIKLKIVPEDTKINSVSEYHVVIEAKSAPKGGFYFLNVTIPKGYTFSMPPSGKQIAKYTWFNHKNESRVIVYIISNTTDTVDVRFSINSGRTFITQRGLPLTNIVIGTASLKFIATKGNVNYFNISLGGTAGPILEHELVEIELAKDTLTSPGVQGDYTWMLEAKNSPGSAAFTATAIMKVKGR